MGSYVSPNGRRIVKTGSGRTESEAKAKLKEVLRDYEDGPAIAPSDYTVKDAIGEWLRYGFSSRGQQTVSYNVRARKIRVYKGTTVNSYTVRWTVAGKDFTEPFRNAAQADSFRSELLAAARKGEAFSTVTGRPMSWKRVSSEMTWYDFACAYTDMKWKAAAAGYRKNIARALTAATPDMLTADRGKPEGALLRKRPLPPTSTGGGPRQAPHGGTGSFSPTRSTTPTSSARSTLARTPSAK